MVRYMADATEKEEIENTEAEDTEEAKAESSDAENAQEEPVAKVKKQKKVVRRRKTKKERENPLTMAVRLAVESGKVDFGGRAGIGSADNVKLFIIASNAPGDIKEKIEARSKDSKVPLILFEGSSMELGSVCGKPFPVSVLSVFEEGSSNILELAKKK